MVEIIPHSARNFGFFPSVAIVSFCHRYLISAFRHIAHGGRARELRGFSRAAAHLARIGALCTILVFFADAINVNILYAAILGNFQFQDNPYILDSASDATSVVPNVVRPHINYFEVAKYDGGRTSISNIPKFHGTTIIEDEDSPTILDGCSSTATLTYDIRSYAPIEEAALPASALSPTLDRTITFGRLQI